MKKKELINAVQSRNIWSLDELWASFPAIIANTRGYCMTVHELAKVKRTEHLNVIKTKHYISCVDVYKCEDGFVGVEGIKYAINGFKDCSPSEVGKLLSHACTAVEYEAVSDYVFVPLSESPYKDEPC